MIEQEQKVLEELSRLKIKCIPRYFGNQRFNDFEAIVLEYMDCSLTNFLKGKSIEEFVQICMKMQDCLEEFHRSGYVHLDVKPDNFMIKNGQIKLIDFGLSQKYINKDGDHINFSST